MSAKTILMADNLREFVDERCEFLKKAGYHVITAYSPAEAEEWLVKGDIDLAVLDIRMVDDEDEEDTTGLELARQFGPDIPIILLTGYPTWEHVKAALGRDMNGLSPAVDFLSKPEGPGVMVTAVKFTLERPRLKQNVLQAFQAESYQALQEALQKSEPEETTDKFQKSLERTENDLLEYRKEISRQSERYQKIAISMGLVGIGVVILGALLVFLEITPLAVLSGVGSAVSEAISLLFIRRTAQAAKQVDKNYKELQEIYKAGHLISICDTIQNKTKRENLKISIVEKLAGKWFC